MTAPAPAAPGRLSVRHIVFAGIAYAVIGVGTSQLDPGPTGRGIPFWRLAAWLLSGAVLLLHTWDVRWRRGLLVARSAFEVALGAALGGFLLALGGPVRSHWASADRSRALWSLLAFPVFMGVVAFVAAIVVASLLRRQAVNSSP
jgi:hypothetical protein